MSTDSDRKDVILKYKGLAVAQALLGVGLLICGIMGTHFSQDDEYFGPPYFLGGYLVGIVNLFAALLATCVVSKGGDDNLSDIKRREVGCAVSGHYTLAMFTIVLCFISLVFAGVFGTTYGEDEDVENKSTNVNISYAIIAGCIASLLATFFAMYLICSFGGLFGVQVSQSNRGRVVLTMNTNTVQSNPNYSNPSTFSTQTTNNTQMEQLRAQNLLLQQQLSLQQQQLLLQQQQRQQGFSGGQDYPPPPAYSSVVSDPAYPPPNPVYPSAPDPPPTYKGF